MTHHEQKKVAFLTQAKLELQLSNLTCIHARVEGAVGGEVDGANAGTCHPVAERATGGGNSE